MTTITQPQIDQVNALYKDPETGKGILEGWTVHQRGGLQNCNNTYHSTITETYRAISALVHKLLEQEQRSGVWIDGEFREVLRESVGACPYCKSGVRKKIKCKCGATLASIPFDEHATANEYWCKTSRRFWLAPPPVVEPEPEWEVAPVTETTDEAIVKFYGDSVSATCLKCDGSGCAHEKAVMDKELQEHKNGTPYWDETYIVTRKQQQSKEQA